MGDASSKRLPGLDGFRTLSIGIVLFFHAAAGAGKIDDSSVIYNILEGEFGVRIFFVISGFLISTLLVNEERERGGIHLREFYLRRSAKLLPSLWTYLGIVALVALWTGVQLPWSSWLRAMFFMTGHPQVHLDSGITNHTWSLSIEEAFYILWAPFIAAGLWRARRIAVLALVILYGTGARFLDAAQTFTPDTFLHFTVKISQFSGDIAWGCLAALLLAEPRWRQRLIAFANRVVPVAWLWLPVAQLGHYPFVPHFGTACKALGLGVQSAAIALLLVAYSTGRKGWVSNLLNHPVVTYIGRASYSIYIWQQPFFFSYVGSGQMVDSLVLNLVLSVAVGLLAFQSLETPVLRWLRARLRLDGRSAANAMRETASPKADAA